MNQCTGVNMLNRGFVFESSRCRSYSNPSGVRVWCHHYNDIMYHLSVDQTCENNEICVDSGPNLLHGRAYCVSTKLYTEFAAGELATMGYEVPATGIASHPMSAQALLVSRAQDKAMRAKKIELRAFGRHASSGPASALRELRRGRASCEDCSTVNLEPLPRGAKYLRAQVMSRKSGPGLLYLTTIS